MSDENKPVIRNDMFGRLDIYASYDEITEDNIVSELNSALVYHIQNMLQEEFLYWYTRGVQPILNRHKDIREDILNIVQVNTAAEIAKACGTQTIVASGEHIDILREIVKGEPIGTWFKA